MSDTVRFIHEFRLDDAPPAVVRHAKRFLLDLIGVAAAGSRLDASRILRRTALTLFSAGQGGSRFLFDGQAASPAGAALVNAGTIDAFDAHDAIASPWDMPAAVRWPDCWPLAITPAPGPGRPPLPT